MATKAVNLRVDEELYQYLQDRAEKEHRTVSNMIISVLSDERKIGQWIDADEDEWFGEQGECPFCGHVTIDIDNYCPHCGTKMKKHRKKAR